MKLILFLGLSLLAAASVSAQNIDPGYLGDQPYKTQVYKTHSEHRVHDFYTASVGIAAGVNISNTVNAYNLKFGTGAIVGFHGGITFDLPLFYPVSFAPEALYSQKGYASSSADGNFTLRTQYIDVPLLLKFKLAPIFNIYLGPQFSYLLSTQDIVDNGSQVTSEHYYSSPGFHVFSGVGGISFDLGRHAELRARYILDLQPIKPTGDPNYLNEFRNQVVQIGLGFKL